MSTESLQSVVLDAVFQFYQNTQIRAKIVENKIHKKNCAQITLGEARSDDIKLLLHLHKMSFARDVTVTCFIRLTVSFSYWAY